MNIYIDTEFNDFGGELISLGMVDETVAAHNSAYGDYTTPPWERLADKDKDHTCAKVAAFLNNPGLHPTAHHGTAVAALTASQRAAAYVFHGVVHAIAREQSRD